MIRNLLIALALFAALLFLPGWIRRLRSQPERWIELGELEDRLAGSDELLVADVRGPDEFSGPLGHIPGARNIPIDELPGRIDEFEARDKAIVLVCKTDRRSAAAAKLLRERGFGDVCVLRGGMEAWQARARQVGPADLR